MTSPTGSTRKLPYPLYFSQDIESQTPPDNVAFVDLATWSEPDPDIRTDIVLNLSLNEYVALANCIDVGRDIAYGDNSIYLWWLWVRGIQSMAICESMIDCIENDVGVQNAIQNAVNGNPEFGGQQDRIDSDAFASATCDKDAIYGYTVALWNYINDSNIDALQIVAEATNASEQLSKILTSVIPGLELLPVDEILGWVESFGNYNLEAYEASITVGLEEEIICDLFCIAVANNCTLVFADVYDYFVDKMGGINIPTALATLGEWIQFMVLGSYPTDRIVYLWSAFQLSLAFMGQKFLGLNTLSRYSLIAKTGDADNDWELLCGDCDTPFVRVFMGQLNSDDPTAFGWIAPFGTFSTSGSTTVWRDTVDGSNVASELIYTFTHAITLTRWFARVNTAIQGSGKTSIIEVLDDVGTVLDSDSFLMPAGNTVKELDINNVSIAMGVGYQIRVRTVANGAGVALILGIQIEGFGVSPWA